jgi:hypothetical protein
MLRIGGSMNNAGQASVIGYTRPSGLNLLALRWFGTREQLARYSLTGALTKIRRGRGGVLRRRDRAGRRRCARPPARQQLGRGHPLAAGRGDSL